MGVDGGSTGGWVSLALQTFYPDFFNGAWSRAPDPVDFRAYELITNDLAPRHAALRRGRLEPVRELLVEPDRECLTHMAIS